MKCCEEMEELEPKIFYTESEHSSTMWHLEITGINLSHESNYYTYNKHISFNFCPFCGAKQYE